MVAVENPRRPSRKLSWDEAVESWILLIGDWFKNRIAARYDVNVWRLYEVWNEKVHVGSKTAAIEKLMITQPALASKLTKWEPPKADNDHWRQPDLFSNDNLASASKDKKDT